MKQSINEVYEDTPVSEFLIYISGRGSFQESMFFPWYKLRVIDLLIPVLSDSITTFLQKMVAYMILYVS